MIEKILLCSFFTFACWYSMQEEEIFGFVGNKLADLLPPKLHNPFFGCPVCMGFWYGSLFYWLVYHNNFKEWIIVAICTVGINTVFSKLFPPDE